MARAARAAPAAHPLLAPMTLHDERERLALALALKDLGYEALYRDPPRVQAALARLGELHAGAAGAGSPAMVPAAAAPRSWER